jgi:hypothetical protein
MVFALLVPAAVYGARVGWVTASESVERCDKIVGWGIVAACIFASTALRGDARKAHLKNRMLPLRSTMTDSE